MTPVIDIGVDPYVHLGPFTLAWHGLIAIGVLIAGLMAASEARRRGLRTEPLQTMGLLLVVGAVLGSKVFYLFEHSLLGDPSAWFSSHGFTFYGGLVLCAALLAIYIWRAHLSADYLDAVALGLPLGYGIGRIGDIINGEHYGPATTFFLGVRNTHPDADVPSHAIAYHNGGLYESMIGFASFAVAFALRGRLRPHPTAMVWLVLGLLAAGRFVEFFVRSDSAKTAVGLEVAQWTSLVLSTVAMVGAWVTRARRVDRSAHPTQ